MPINGYFDTIFASSGDLTSVPDPVQGSGSISYAQGWPSGYDLPLTNPSAFPVGRSQTNQLFFDVTSSIQQYQQHGTPPFITSTMNNGSPFSYGIGDRVINGGIVYTSIAAGNTDVPPSSKWSIDALTISSINTGYQIMASGFILQWQKVIFSGTTFTATLPLTFPHQNERSFASLFGTTPISGLSFTAEPASASTVLITASAALSSVTGVNILSVGY